MAAKLCNVCNTRRVYTGNKGTDVAPSGSQMCNYCFEEGGWENTHNDYNHADIAEIVEHAGDAQLSDSDKAELSTMANCWFCHPELNLAQKPKQASTGPKTQGTRRPQLNHKGHSHPQTPAARRACKAAFWASLAASGQTKQAADLMAGWNWHCDGFGKPKPAPQPKPAKLTVVPRGPKGGVINQLKKGNPAK